MSSMYLNTEQINVTSQTDVQLRISAASPTRGPAPIHGRQLQHVQAANDTLPQDLAAVISINWLKFMGCTL